VESALMVRDKILHKIRTALGRSPGQLPEPVPPVHLSVPEVAPETRIQQMLANVENLAGKVYRGNSPAQVREYIAGVTGQKTAVASNAPLLETCGITALPNVRSGIFDAEELRALCATAAYGITAADYALADTGTLVLLSSRSEARLISLLPPGHIAVVAQERILTGLDELFSVLPQPAEQSSSMVLITGPSRTADIEQILVRGVHGPGEIHVVVV
jgi:L-lactate dehydrogenase complex protein LldG